MRYKHRSKEPIIRYFVCLFSLITIVFIFALSNKKSFIVASNVNTVKAIESSRIKVVDEVKNQKKIIEFTGSIIGYNADLSNLSCLPDVTNIKNDLYYNDRTYGTVRILSHNLNIPCGSIIKVSNYDNQNFLGIILDKDEVLDDLTLKLLFNNQQNIENLNIKSDINFKVERWGY